MAHHWSVIAGGGVCLPSTYEALHLIHSIEEVGEEGKEGGNEEMSNQRNKGEIGERELRISC